MSNTASRGVIRAVDAVSSPALASDTSATKAAVHASFSSQSEAALTSDIIARVAAVSVSADTTAAVQATNVSETLSAMASGTSSSVPASSNQTKSAVPTGGNGTIVSSSPSTANSTARNASQPSTDSAAAVFNSTVTFTLNCTSPMVNFDGPESPRWEMDQSTSFRRYTVNSGGRMFGLLRFVGVGYGINGSIAPLPGVQAYPDDGVYTWVEDHVVRRTLSDPKVDNPNLGEATNFSLAVHNLDLVMGEAVIEVHNFTVHIPVKTQATNVDAMRSQAKTAPTIQNGTLSSSMKWGPVSVGEELSHSGVDHLSLVKHKAAANVIDGHLVLAPNTELSYPIPHNTTLVEVLGPVGNSTAWLGRSECYASFNPKPEWWQESKLPVSTSFKLVNSTDQTMFLLPIDPQIAFDLKIGSFGNSTTCPISAIRAYPFQYNFKENLTNQTNSNSSAVGSTLPHHEKANKTTLIVGIVVGVGGGLILLGLALWFSSRHRRQQAKRHNELLPDPYPDNVAGQPRSKAELQQTANTESPRSATPGSSEASDDESMEEPRHWRGRRIVQEEDGEGVLQPPQYGEASHAGAEPGASRPTPQAEDRETLAGPPSLHMAGSMTAPIQDPALEAKVRALSSNRPRLKQQYERAFGRALPQPPDAMLEAGQPRPSPNAPSKDLKHEYKKRFAPRSSQGRSDADPESEGMDLHGEYKKQFASSP